MRTLRIALPVILLSFFSGKAQSVTDSLHRVLRATKTDTVRINSLNALSHEFRENNPDSAIRYAVKALTLSNAVKFGNGIAESHMNYGNAMIILSRYHEALKHFKFTGREYGKLLDEASGSEADEIRNNLARTYGSMGVVYSELNNYPEALAQYFEALKLYRQTNQKSGIAKVCNNIGIVYKSQEHLSQALEYLSKAAKIQEETGEQSAAVTLTNIGAIYFEQNKKDKALEYYGRAKNLFTSIENKRGEALLYSYIGDYYLSGNVEKSQENYDKALELYTSLDNKFGESLVLYNLGGLQFKRKDYVQAKQSAERSLALAREISTPDQIRYSEKLLSDIYQESGDPAKALLHFREYVRIKDSLENEETTRKFVRAEMNAAYRKKEALMHERNKSQKQLTLFLIFGGLLLLLLIFVTYNRLQVKRRLTLQKEVAEYEQKALHLQMNPHFVFNCLGSISSFIVQNGTDSAIKYLSKFSKLMRLTLEYSKATLIPIDKEIEGLNNYLELEQLRFNRKFEFKISTTPAVEDDLALPPLLIQPFVENAILHGLVPKDDDGRIDIVFDVKDDCLVCSITDDGIGFSKSKELKENSVTAHQSRALEITQKRLGMMKAAMSKPARVDIEEIKDNGTISGTRVTLWLPLQYTSDIKNRI